MATSCRHGGSLLVRDYIQRALYGGAASYFSRDVVRRVEQPFRFPDFLGEADYRQALANHYAAVRCVPGGPFASCLV